VSRHPLLAIGLLLTARLVAAQSHEHRPGMSHEMPAREAGRDAAPSTTRSAATATATATETGQGAFAAIAEIVRLLEADRTTDWSKVDLEALRQHLIDMDDLTLRSVVRTEAVPGGATFTVTGTGRVRDAIRRMAREHGMMMAGNGLTWETAEIAEGVRVTVRASSPTDARAVARIRGLGFIGLMTVGEHHTMHHLGVARGTMRH
jgi:hypothetical protein